MQTVKAGTLIYSLIMTLLMSAVSGSLLLFGYYSRMEFDLIYAKERLLMNVNSGINLLLVDEYQIIKNDEPVTIDLFGNGRDSVLLEKKSYGALEVIRARAAFRNISESKIALIGSSLTYKGDTNVALFLYDNNRPLSICGNTLLKGDCYLSEEGIRRAYIEGQSFSGSKLIEGTMKQSGKEFPQFSKTLYENLVRILNLNFSINDSVADYHLAVQTDTLLNSFENKALILYSKNLIQLDNFQYLKGNIIVVSDTMIRVNTGTRLEDVILMAPHIIIEKHFTGTLQAYASDSLIIRQGCHLEYPSVAGMIQNNNSENGARLVLEDGVELSGALFAYATDGRTKNEPGIITGKNTIIRGEIYSGGWVDIKGAMHGMMITKKIMLTTPSSVYENHILNAVIDRTSLPGYFSGVCLTGETYKKKISKWLN